MSITEIKSGDMLLIKTEEYMKLIAEKFKKFSDTEIICIAVRNPTLKQTIEVLRKI